MLHMPRIPELAQRDRFVRRAVSQARVLTLADEEFASVPSQKLPGRTVQLFWSSEIEAKRWAKALTGDDGLQDIPLHTFVVDILPGIGAAKGLAGTDWVSDPIEAEIDPADLILRLKTESLSDLARGMVSRGEVFLVAGDQGPMVQASTQKPNRHASTAEVLAVFSARADAERHMKRTGGKNIIADPIADFLASTLPWAQQRGHGISLEPIPGAGPIEVPATDWAARLTAT